MYPCQQVKGLIGYMAVRAVHHYGEPVYGAVLALPPDVKTPHCWGVVIAQFFAKFATARSLALRCFRR